MRENRTYGLMRGPGETHNLRGAGFYSTQAQDVVFASGGARILKWPREFPKENIIIYSEQAYISS